MLPQARHEQPWPGISANSVNLGLLIYAVPSTSVAELARCRNDDTLVGPLCLPLFSIYIDRNTTSFSISLPKMKGIQIAQYVSGPQDMKVTELDDPVPNPDQYTIAIHATACNCKHSN